VIIDIPYKLGDDKQYLTAICSLVASLASLQEPAEIYVTRVKKWFDRKWLRYSGKGIIPMWREQLTFPPFNPQQIGTQMYWRQRSDGSYGGVPKPRWIHKRELRHSTDNLNNRVADLTDSGLFIWFSSDTDKNAHGSILVYSVASSDVSAWYASFRRDSEWRINKVVGISRSIVERCFPLK
jgi:hypothetical protein